MHKVRIELASMELLRRAWLSAIDIFFKAISVNYIFHLGFPENVVVTIKFDWEGMVEG